MLRLFAVSVTAFMSCCLWGNDTELKLYRPFGETALQDPVVIQQEVSGQCIQQSQRIKREDAWRCIAFGKTYDPCFVKQFASTREAVCPQSPWAGSSVKINLISAVDNNQNAELNMAEAYPWAVELMSGEKCQAMDSDEFEDGLPVRYRCDNQSVLFGHLQRCKSEWSMLQKNTNGVSTAFLMRAWF